ncbi:hypothetical protein GCM10011309_16270 [Litorimonas cladophorae]|uniref:Endolytic peptidoglycan transglycosylase RlpA n=1 Tax=Litorimonas cladophorae TaxID=1220491 RepID=A0A918KKW8_9PROT|nr:septal ring lytic transglycosylase RlpA family protein [Litorimonas cladophorae]GGX67332.1 hypothetical protein GCM10011309_16270 [Litorimonas cladophorae]
MTIINSTVRNFVALAFLGASFGFVASGCSSGKSTKPVSAAKFKQNHVEKALQPNQIVGKKYKVRGKTYRPKHEPKYDETGTASWYGAKFHGKPTATGEPFNMYALTAAHPTLPLNSLLHVTNLDNGKQIIVRLNDRGPFTDKRIIDLSKSAADKLGIQGLAKVRVQYAGPA